MSRPYDRPALAVALVNAAVVYLLPLGFAGVLSFLRANPNGSTMVVGVDPDRAAVLARNLRFWVSYGAVVAPFAMAAAWRTFVHARRWLDGTGNGARGILEGAACGFGGAVLILLPGILTKPLVAPPFVIAYGGLSAALGLACGAVLWLTAAAVLQVIGIARKAPAYDGPRQA